MPLDNSTTSNHLTRFDSYCHLAESVITWLLATTMLTDRTSCSWHYSRSRPISQQNGAGNMARLIDYNEIGYERELWKNVKSGKIYCIFVTKPWQKHEKIMTKLHVGNERRPLIVTAATGTCSTWAETLGSSTLFNWPFNHVSEFLFHHSPLFYLPQLSLWRSHEDTKVDEENCPAWSGLIYAPE